MIKIDGFNLKGIEMKNIFMSLVLVMLTTAALTGCDSNPLKGQADPLADKSDEGKDKDEKKANELLQDAYKAPCSMSVKK